MKTHTLLALICLSLLTPTLFGQTNAPADSTNAMTTPPPIPEEARKHFVMGETMFKEAKSADNFSQAASEFFQAANLAPQWPEARYNLALAKEAAGDYSGAMDDLKIYQQFKLSDDEARTVQDKIYAIQAKQQMQASDAAAKAAADAAAAQAQAAADAAKAKALEAQNVQFGGNWNLPGANFHIARDSSGNWTVNDGADPTWTTTTLSVDGRNFNFTGTANGGRDRLSYTLTLSDDGDRFVGQFTEDDGPFGTSHYPVNHGRSQ